MKVIAIIATVSYCAAVFLISKAGSAKAFEGLSQGVLQRLFSVA
jgi:hypothetical protein